MLFYIVTLAVLFRAVSAVSTGTDCVVNICMNGGCCYEFCDDTTQQILFRECLCPTGFTGLFCEINILCTSNPCLNGGCCLPSDSGLCMCQPGFFGQFCENINNPCTPDPCLNGGSCYTNGGVAMCLCPQGYSGQFCENINNPCTLNYCLNAGCCYTNGGVAMCLCQPGFSGQFCELPICIPNPCLNGGCCYAAGGLARCMCQDGFFGQFCEATPTSGNCTSCGDPHVQTFDSFYYDFYEAGDFVMVDSTINNFKVHARTYNCGGSVTCNCGVAAQENNEIIIIDACNSVGPTFRFILPDPNCVGVTLKQLSSTTFLIQFSSGASVTFHAYGSYANIKVYVPSQYFQTTSGLCGTLDHVSANDSYSSDGIVYPNSQLANINFVRSWKLRSSSSLFFTPAVPSTCNTGPQPICPNTTQNLRQTFTTDSRTILPVGLQNCNNDDIIYVQQNDVIPNYNPPDQDFILPTWPTPSGKTLSGADAMCDTALRMSIAGQACLTFLGPFGTFDMSPFQAQCVTDILLSDTYQFIESAVNAMTMLCEEIVLGDPFTYWSPDVNGVLVPPILIGNNICPQDCNGNGVCAGGVCVCDATHEGDDCSLIIGQSPVLTSPFKLCDIRNDACLVIDIEGLGFSSNLICKSTKLQIDIHAGDVPPYTETTDMSQSSGTLISFAEITCPLPLPPVNINGNPLSTVGNPIGGFNIQVSNDGVDFSNAITTLIVYDSKCIQCSMLTGICNLKANTCKINGYCFLPGELNPASSFQHCDPTVDIHIFTDINNGITPPPVSCPIALCQGLSNGNYEYRNIITNQVNSHYFLQCSNGFPYCQPCLPQSLHFVPRCNQCLNSLTDDCYVPNTSTDVVPTHACPANECSTRGNKFSGNINDPNESHHYIACWKGRTVACINCPANLQFNEAINRCE